MKKVDNLLINFGIFIFLILGLGGIFLVREVISTVFASLMILTTVLLYFYKDKIKIKKIKEKKIEYDAAIGLIKVLAILKIVTLHFAHWWQVYIPIFYFNGFSLRLFVIASGFGLTVLHFKGINTSKLIWNQLKKTYVAMILTLIVIFIGLYFKFGNFNFFDYLFDLMKAGLGIHVQEIILFLNWIIGNIGFDYRITVYPLTNGAWWFISLIIWLYLLFPAFLWTFKKIKPEIFMGVLLLLGFSLSLFFDPWQNSIVYNLFFFAFGIYFAMNYHNFKNLLKEKTVLFGLFTLTLIVLTFSFFYSFYQYIFEIFMFLTMYVILSNKWINSWLWIKRYDKVVFFLYLIHQPFIGVLGFIWSDKYSYLKNFSNYLIYLTIVLIISLILLVIFEKVYSYLDRNRVPANK